MVGTDVFIDGYVWVLMAIVTMEPCNTSKHTATHCNTLQHTATHCNMQHTRTLRVGVGGGCHNGAFCRAQHGLLRVSRV